MRVSRAWPSLFAVACRWGGPEGEPSDLFGPRTAIEPTDAVTGGEARAAARAGVAEADAGEAAVMRDGLAESAPGNRADEAGPRPAFPGAAGAGDAARQDTPADGMAGADGTAAQPGSADAGLQSQPSPESCRAPAGLPCDPVTNDGCLPLTQCVADSSVAGPAARCVLGSISLGATCTQDLLSTSCPPQHTCVAGQCREYCYCDADCVGASACTDPSAPGESNVFQLCARSL